MCLFIIIYDSLKEFFSSSSYTHLFSTWTFVRKVHKLFFLLLNSNQPDKHPSVCHETTERLFLQFLLSQPIFSSGRIQGWIVLRKICYISLIFFSTHLEERKLLKLRWSIDDSIGNDKKYELIALEMVKKKKNYIN